MQMMQQPMMLHTGLGGTGIGTMSMGIGSTMSILPMALTPDACSTLYVEGLPSSATEREVAHIFRPFPGFQSLRIRHKVCTIHACYVT
jgi:RNA recognition motif. (a.k.a. RRM, RBD, or RNP domain)